MGCNVLQEERKRNCLLAALLEIVSLSNSKTFIFVLVSDSSPRSIVLLTQQNANNVFLVRG